TDIQPPNVDLRMAILKQKAKDMHFQVSEEVCTFLAQKIRANVRELEGALIRMGSYINLTQASWSIETAKVALQELLSRQVAQAPNIEDIQKKVAMTYDIRVSDIISKKRPANIAFPRQVAMYLSRELTHQPLIAIGEAFGGRDHGTVIHACKVVENQMDVDDNVRDTIQKLKNELEF
ncbi:MAG: chromosomal replication initiator protein DnaA, partial [Verrucomicrobia bacterium]|nr:chromosomal replication initiator protein DnaA [Verrucomicrobiota bacterium]